MYTDMNKVYTKAESRLNDQRLAAFTSHMSDFSKMATASRIAQTVANFDSAPMYKDALGAGEGIYTVDFSMKNFDADNKARDFAAAPAATTAKGGFEGVRGVDVVDLTVLGTVKSVIPTMAVDYAMQKPSDVIQYQKLVAVDDHGELVKDEYVVNPYKPMNYKAKSSIKEAKLEEKTTITLSDVDGDGAAEEFSFGAPVVPGSVKITLAGDITGEDLKKDGNIYFLGKSNINCEVVDYTTGTFKFSGSTGTVSATIEALADMGGEYEGTHTLRLKPAPEKLLVDAEQHSVQLENNIESISFMNKQVLGKNFGEVATRQMLDAFVYTLNAEVVECAIKSALEFMDGKTVPEVDVSTYYASNSMSQFSTTKEDRILDFIHQVELEMQQQSDRAFNYILCDNVGARMLMGLQGKFKAIPTQLARRDGLMGYLDLGYAQIAVVKHQAMDATDWDDDDASKYGHYVFGFKDPEGLTANVGYFEYLPICSTKVALNYLQPTQFSQSVFNYSTAHELIKQYAYVGKIKVKA